MVFGAFRFAESCAGRSGAHHAALCWSFMTCAELDAVLGSVMDSLHGNGRTARAWEVSDRYGRRIGVVVRGGNNTRVSYSASGFFAGNAVINARDKVVVASYASVVLDDVTALRSQRWTSLGEWLGGGTHETER